MELVEAVAFKKRGVVRASPTAAGAPAAAAAAVSGPPATVGGPSATVSGRTAAAAVSGRTAAATVRRLSAAVSPSATVGGRAAAAAVSRSSAARSGRVATAAVSRLSAAISGSSAAVTPFATVRGHAAVAAVCPTAAVCSSATVNPSATASGPSAAVSGGAGGTDASAEAAAAPAPGPASAAPRRPGLMKRVMVPLCALYGLYTFIAYIITLTVVVIEYREQLNPEAVDKELNASSFINISEWESVSALDAVSPKGVSEDSRNYSSPNGTRVNAGDVAVLDGTMKRILLNYSSVVADTEVLGSYNTTIGSRDHDLDKFVSPNSSSGKGIFSPGDVGVSAYEEIDPDGFLSRGTNDSFISLETLQKYQVANTSLEMRLLPDGMTGEERPSNSTDSEGLGTEPTIPPPANANESTESTNTYTISGSSNYTLSLFHEDRVGVNSAGFAAVGSGHMTNASTTRSDPAPLPTMADDALHSENSTMNTTSVIDANGGIVALANAIDGVLRNISLSDATNLGVNESAVPLGSVDGITNSNFNISTSGLGSISDFVALFAGSVDDALNYSLNDGSVMNVSADSDKVDLLNYSPSTFTSAKDASNGLPVAPLETIDGSPFIKYTENTSGSGSASNYVSLSNKNIPNSHNYSSAAALDDVSEVTEPPNPIFRIPFNYSVDELNAKLETSNSTIAWSDFTDVPGNYPPNNTDSETDIGKVVAVATDSVLRNSSSIPHKEISSANAVGWSPASEGGEWRTDSALSDPASSDSSENASSSNATSASTVVRNFSEGESPASVNHFPDPLARVGAGGVLSNNDTSEASTPAAAAIATSEAALTPAAATTAASEGALTPVTAASKEALTPVTAASEVSLTPVTAASEVSLTPVTAASEVALIPVAAATAASEAVLTPVATASDVILTPVTAASEVSLTPVTAASEVALIPVAAASDVILTPVTAASEVALIPVAAATAASEAVLTPVAAASDVILTPVTAASEVSSIPVAAATAGSEAAFTPVAAATAAREVTYTPVTASTAASYAAVFPADGEVFPPSLVQEPLEPPDQPDV